MDTAALARNTDPQTSHDAAADVQDRVSRAEALVLRALHSQAPLIWDEIAEITGLRPGTVSPRFAPMIRKGLIERREGEVRTGESGSKQREITLTTKGYDKIQAMIDAGTAPPLRPRQRTGNGGPRAIIVPKGQAIDVGLIQEGTRIAVVPDSGVVAAQIDTITDAQWSKILDGQLNMKGWCRKRFKRALRLLVEGRIYDDADEDGRKKP